MERKQNRLEAVALGGAFLGQIGGICMLIYGAAMDPTNGDNLGYVLGGAAIGLGFGYIVTKIADRNK